MTAAEQHHEWGASVEASEDKVILTAGRGIAVLTGQQAQHLAFYLANAYLKAGKPERTAGGNLKIARSA